MTTSRTGMRPARLAVAGTLATCAMATLALLLLAGVAGLASSSGATQPSAGTDPPAFVKGIPPAYLRLYSDAARVYGIDWSVLAGIGKVECDHGRDADPSCTREGAVNAAGAGGPMQFLAATWAVYGVDGDADGRVDRWDPADAVYGAADYLRASGLRSEPRRAIFAYNHSASYVDTVLAWAQRYAREAADGAPAGLLSTPSAGGADLSWLAARTSTPVIAVPGSAARLLAGEGHVALVPVQAPPVVQAMIVAGNELQGLAYGPGGHPDPRGVAEEDCSSTVNYLLYRSGYEAIDDIVRRNPVAQTYVRWGLPGPGRWVTIFAADRPTPHVFVVVANLRLDTSHDGTDVGPNRLQDGPRWRILDHIPTWAHWSVRHPPGL